MKILEFLIVGSFPMALDHLMDTSQSDKTTSWEKKVIPQAGFWDSKLEQVPLEGPLKDFNYSYYFFLLLSLGSGH